MGMENDGTKYRADKSEIKLMLKNYGQTPASNVSSSRIIPGATDSSNFDYTEGHVVARNQITHPGQHFGQIVGILPPTSDPHREFKLYGLDTTVMRSETRVDSASPTDTISVGGDSWRPCHDHIDEIPEPEDRRPFFPGSLGAR